MSLAAAERLSEDDGHHTQHGAWPWRGTCYIAIEKEKKKRSDCIYHTISTPFTISENVLETGEAKGVQPCYFKNTERF